MRHNRTVLLVLGGLVGILFVIIALSVACTDHEAVAATPVALDWPPAALEVAVEIADAPVPLRRPTADDLAGGIRGVPADFWAIGLLVIETQLTWYGEREWDPRLLGQIHQESRWDTRARSPVGARGLTQFMPSTERLYEAATGIRGDIFDPVHAATLQSLYMKEMAKKCAPKFRDDRSIWWCMAMSYNGAPRSFDREHNAAGAPRTIVAPIGWPCLRGRAAWCRENRSYPVLIERWRTEIYGPLLGSWWQDE